MSLLVRRPQSRTRLSRGFTLLELIIVLVVLAALAALVIPTLGFVRDSARYATAAAGAAEVLNNLEIYKSATGNYPARMDALTTESGELFRTVYNDGSGGFPLGRIIPGGTASYFMANGGGVPSVVYHTQASATPSASYDPNDSTGASLPNTAFPYLVSVDPAYAGAFYNAKVARVMRTIYPNQATGGTSTSSFGVPAGHTLIALGVGGRNAAVGSTMTSAPICPGAPATSYARYIALFDVWSGATGRGKVTLKAVVDHEFETIAGNTKNYRTSGPLDELGSYSASQ